MLLLCRMITDREVTKKISIDCKQTQVKEHKLRISSRLDLILHQIGLINVKSLLKPWLRIRVVRPIRRKRRSTNDPANMYKEQAFCLYCSTVRKTRILRQFPIIPLVSIIKPKVRLKYCERIWVWALIDCTEVLLFDAMRIISNCFLLMAGRWKCYYLLLYQKTVSLSLVEINEKKSFMSGVDVHWIVWRRSFFHLSLVDLFSTYMFDVFLMTPLCVACKLYFFSYSLFYIEI